MQLQGLDHVVIRTSKVEQLLAFYQQVLGATLERVLEDEGLYQLRAGAALIDLLSTTGSLDSGAPPDARSSPIAHICLQVRAPSEQALIRSLKRKGVMETLVFATRYGATGFGRSLYIHDPDDNTLELKLV
ncbi:VOC family protein [Pseudoalteromonas sp. BDTF-M6]|uniref:VOC family protein n=1 Tax=Pseudoalteromonas sp. BDTF-M6 TaxID=2796132 RepID=UPI001BB03582|nr:VOC family protein [Pseudoalteromonas sp. BDTF-M6]MBS3796540.1 VOC family protein [Pseudoalteromonas sp. BDTF-M6]